MGAMLAAVGRSVKQVTLYVCLLQRGGEGAGARGPSPGSLREPTSPARAGEVVWEGS